jgi:VanZ family protein
MGVMLMLSTDLGSGAHTSRWLTPVLRLLWPGASPLQIEALHGLIRKAAHVTEYAVLTALWFRALAGDLARSAGRAAGAALGIATGWAVLDETHQAFVLSRTGSPGDVVLDVLGAATAAAVARWGWRRAGEAVTGALLWIAAVGGALLIVLDVGVGVPAGLLWVTVPTAVVALVIRRFWGPLRR